MKEATQTTTIKTFGNGKNNYQLNEISKDGKVLRYEIAFEVFDGLFQDFLTYECAKYENNAEHTKRAAVLGFLTQIQNLIYEDVLGGNDKE